MKNYVSKSTGESFYAVQLHPDVCPGWAKYLVSCGMVIYDAEKEKWKIGLLEATAGEWIVWDGVTGPFFKSRVLFRAHYKCELKEVSVWNSDTYK